ncbi:MAG: prepilin-type N-terminal cleavage/methylation domain-containing protein [Peptococcaceae bacterium]|nr:prepilin-type N-terminal cleavage/methylation domain-containing protein [Peptococcaceae bacterium]
MLRYLKNNQGFTLIEIIMAIVAFGIFLTTVSSIYGFVEGNRTNSLDQIQMAELAQAEIEKIKVNAWNNLDSIPVSWEKTINYPNDILVSKSYLVKYETSALANGKMLKITIGQAPNDYIFGAWLPPRETVDLYTEEEVIYNPINWSTDPTPDSVEPVDMGSWDIVPSEVPGDPPYLVVTEPGAIAPIYSLVRTYVPEFEYKVDIKVGALDKGVCESGLVVLDEGTDGEYKFYFEGNNGNVDLVVDYPGGSIGLINHILIHEDVNYYFKVKFNQGNPGNIILNFGYYAVDNSMVPLLTDYIDNVSGFSVSDHGYYLGLYNKTAQTSFHYNLPTLSGGDCNG